MHNIIFLKITYVAKLISNYVLASNGVVVATENKRKSLLYETTVAKVQKITPNIGMVYSGKYIMKLSFFTLKVKIILKSTTVSFYLIIVVNIKFISVIYTSKNIEKAICTISKYSKNYRVIFFYVGIKEKAFTTIF